MKNFLKELAYILVNFEKNPTMLNCFIVMLCVLSGIGFLVFFMAYIVEGYIFWRILHVLVLLLAIIVATLVIKTYIRIIIKDNQ